MKTHKFARRPFYVDAVRVSETNIDEVAAWCQGDVQIDEDENSLTQGQKYVKVRVHRPLTDRQTRAYIGDWVLYAGTGYKVYTPKAFDKSFEKVKTLTKEQADAAGIKVPHEPKQGKKPARKRPVPKPPKNPVLTPEAARQLNGGLDEAVQTDEKVVAQQVQAEVKENAVANETAAVNVEFNTSEQKQADAADALINEVLNEKA
jgi:hypothetical protein